MFLLRLPIAFARLIVVSVLLALGQIWSNKMRSVLTTAGIVIGVASVTAVIAAMTGLKANVLAEFEAMGTNKMFFFPRHPDSGPKRTASWRVIRFWPEQFEGMAEHCPSISHVSRIADHQFELRSPYRSVSDVRVLCVDPDWHAIERRSVIAGRPFTMIDIEGERPVCLVTESLRDELRLDRDPVGQTVLIGNRTFHVVGVVEKGHQSMMFGGGRGQQEEAVVPFTTAWRMFQDTWFQAVATSASSEQSDEAQAEARFFLRRMRRLEPGEPDTFHIEVLEKHLEQFRTIAFTMTMVAGGIVGISLLVGGIGIMNIMLVSVSERTREIGLRKAVGARPAAIMLQFLVESITLCLVGGVIGLAFGQLMTLGISNIPGAELGRAYIPWWAVAMSFGFAATVGVVFGMFPAIKAARLDPIEALRHE
jgi:putative ABC transport system permease protein